AELQLHGVALARDAAELEVERGIADQPAAVPLEHGGLHALEASEVLAVALDVAAPVDELVRAPGNLASDLVGKAGLVDLGPDRSPGARVDVGDRNDLLRALLPADPEDAPAAAP